MRCRLMEGYATALKAVLILPTPVTQVFVGSAFGFLGVCFLLVSKGFGIQ
jgi:hypothetical protein